MRRKTRYIVVHCSATGPDSFIGADEIRDWHTRPKSDGGRGWDDIGYHAVIRRRGQIEFGRHFDVAGAHVKGHNYQSVGVCVVGGLDLAGNPIDNFLDAQLESLRWLIAVLARAYPDAEVLGHRDLSPDLDGDGIISSDEWLKECPCFDVRNWLKTHAR